MVYQGHNYRARIDFWCTDLVVVLSNSDNQRHVGLGQLSQAVAHIGSIQHTLDFYQSNGTCPTLSLTV